MQEISQRLLFNEVTRCKPWIEAALRRGLGTHEFEDVASAIMAGKMQLWPASSGCLVTEIKEYPRKKVIHLLFAGGKLADVLKMTDDALDWAKSLGCTMALAEGRKGWGRAYESEHVCTTIKKDL